MTDRGTVHAECDLDPESLYVVDVCPYDIGNNAQQMDQNCCYLCRRWLGSRANRLLHSLHAIQRLLGCSGIESSVHHA